ncbi:MAG: preprotein translocase subunit SecA [bacterium]
MWFFGKLFGDGNQRYLRSLQPLVEKINGLEKVTGELTDEQLKDKTKEFKERLSQGQTLDDLLPEAFAVVRETARRKLGQRHFDVQLIGGIVLHGGQIAEMRTGEGKTLTATLAVYLNALSGKGTHVVTVNDYLAKRDAVTMGQIYNALGLSTAVIQNMGSFKYTEAKATIEEDKVRDISITVPMDFLESCSRKEAYQADILYGTNNEFGFDYLRDNMAGNVEQTVQRELTYAIVDEVDSILIDEARTPLIISGPAAESTEEYQRFAQLALQLEETADYQKDEKFKAVFLTEQGIAKVEHILGVDNLYSPDNLRSVHHIEEALKAKALFLKDRDYVVREGEVIIVDEFTGRLMIGRRYSEGLHQAIEAKEGVKIQQESRTLATITIQNYFRMYKKLSGMTGTAATEAEEFSKIYGLDVTVIPTHRVMIRKDWTDRVYKTEDAKSKAVVEDIKERYAKGQPVLVGTISIEKNERLSELLSEAGIPHQLLNAKNHEKEAGIIAQAGRLKSVTVATNMAGRGVDIILGGQPYGKEEAEKVIALGGLHVIGTERHEARRIDNQLRGRSGRQGDPGSSQFYVSLEDDLMRIFGSDRMKKMMDRLGLPDNIPIENNLVSKSIASAQKKVEGQNFDIRKHLVDYDDVLNKQRDIIYKKRREVISSDNVREKILELVDEELKTLVGSWTVNEEEKLSERIVALFTLTDEEKAYADAVDRHDVEARTELLERLGEIARVKYQEVAAKIDRAAGDAGGMAWVEKIIYLQTIDLLWSEHLDNINHLRTGIGLRSYGQRDPLVEYKREAFHLFQRLLVAIQSQVAMTVFKAGPAASVLKQEQQDLRYTAPAKTMGEGAVIEMRTGDGEFGKVGRNDPCSCGSGKKYKRCHGK